MKLGENKIYTLCLIILIIIGAIVVWTKGFNVDIDLKQHDVFKFKFNQKFEMQDVQKVCEQILEGKEYEIKTVEVFSDAVYIVSPKITENEKNRLVESLGNLYLKNTDEGSTAKKLEDFKVGEDYNLFTDGKVRLRDLIIPYVVPSIISSVIILIYMGIKYRKLNNGKIYVTLFNIILEAVLFSLALIGACAIVRIPVGRMEIPIFIFIVICWLVLKCYDLENKLKSVEG